MNIKNMLTDKWFCNIARYLRQLLSHGFYFSKRTDLQIALNGGDQFPDDLKMSLAVKYYSIKNRIPSPRKHMVRECKGINCPPHLKPGFEMLKQELKDGSCLLSRMSRSAKDLDAVDGMLNDWGIQHFHLGTSPDKDCPDLVQGTKFIAYVYMTDESAYIITIDEHGKWGEKRLLEKLLADFPNALDDWKTDAHELSFEVDGKAREMLRRAHINTAVALNGSVCMRPNGGETMDGSSVSAVRDAQWNLKFFVRFCDFVNKTLIKRGWNDTDIANSRLISFCSGPEWFVQMEKSDGSACEVISFEDYILDTRIAKRVE